MRLRFAVLAVALAGHGALANMMDVFEPNKLPPAECANGCAPWGQNTSSLWAGGKVPADAGALCAQPGAAVDKYVYGAWCFCQTDPSPTPAPAPPADPDHPLDGAVFALFNTYDNDNYFVSFAYTDAPPGEAAGDVTRSWLRANYAASNPKDAMPVKFAAVAGKKNHYKLFNQWGDSEYQHWLTLDDGNTGYVYGSKNATQETAMEVEVVTTGTHANGNPEVVLINRSPGQQAGLYISYASAGYWVRANYANVADAMTLQLVPAGAAPAGGNWGYCTSKPGVPEQVNVQIAGPDAVVVNFVTFESVAPVRPPTVTVQAGGGGGAEAAEAVTGVTHVHTTSAGDRTYYMHFVRLGGLKPRARYSYSVRSGGDGAAESGTFSFRAPYSHADGGKTVANVYGDMGVYSWNNMGNLKQDNEDEAADLVIHMGDHAYNEGDNDERRGDGYINAFEDVIANTPWMPIVGNHEYYGGAELGRFLDQTFEKWGPIAGGDVDGDNNNDNGNNATAAATKDSVYHGYSTATSALGKLLSIGNHHGAGIGAAAYGAGASAGGEAGGSVPSNSSRYFSVDMGLVHLIALDLNMYYGLDPCGDPCRQQQLEWFKADLAKANSNRKNVPWVVAMSHYPFYCTGCYAKQFSSRFYGSEDAEYFGNNNRTANNAAVAKAKRAAKLARRRAEQAGAGAAVLAAIDAEGASWDVSLGASSDSSIKDLTPLLKSGGVDMYIAGHWHYYESLWPAEDGTTGTGGQPLQKDFVDPKITVHVTTGNGGPPSADSFNEDCPGPDCGSIPATRHQSTKYGYGRITAHNATHMQYQQFNNADGSVEDDWYLVQHSHGPFTGRQ